MQKCNRIGKPDLQKIITKYQQIQDTKVRNRTGDACLCHDKYHIFFHIQKPVQHHQDQLGRTDPHEQTACNGKYRNIDSFDEKYPCDMAFFHSQDIINADLSFPPLDDKAVCVKKKNQ